MSYSGYRVMIGENIVPNNVIAKGTYQFYKEKRITGTWKNAAQIEKQDVYSKRKTVIQFSIIPMNLTDHEAIKWLFASQENLLVSYWDDYDCEYKTGYFYMERPQMSHSNSQGGSLFYEAIQIKLTEY